MTETGTFGAATCSGTCGFTCDANFMKCPGTVPVCQRKTWDFENGTTQGFYQLPNFADIANSSVINSTARAHSGTHSLALPLKSSGGTLDVNVTICDGASVPLPTAGRSISFWVYVDGALSSAAGSPFLSAIVTGCLQGVCFTAGMSSTTDPLPVGTWVRISASVSAADAAAHPDTYSISLVGPLSPSSATTVYIDDVVLQ